MILYIRAYVFFNCLTTIIGGEAKIIYQSVQGPMGPVLVSSKTRRNTAGRSNVITKEPSRCYIQMFYASLFSSLLPMLGI